MLTCDSANEFWETRYRDATTPWDRGGVSPALPKWLNEGVLKPCRILIPGCGNGYEVVELARRGFDVTGVDIAPSPLANLKQRLAEAKLPGKLIQADLLVWESQCGFDAIYEQTCLCALVPDLWPQYIERLAAWLDTGGQLLACFMQTDQAGGPPFHCPLDAMRRLFAPPTWRWPEEPPTPIPHSAGFHELACLLTRR